MAEINPEYERGFKDGLKSECLKELKPIMVELAKGCTEAIKGITPMLIDKAQLTIRQEVNRWIPCSERLPDKDEFVLCFCRANITEVLYWNGSSWHSTSAYRGYLSGFVTHWMSLPEPPEKE